MPDPTHDPFAYLDDETLGDQADQATALLADGSRTEAGAPNLPDVDPAEPHRCDLITEGPGKGVRCSLCMHLPGHDVHRGAEPVLADPEPEPVTSTFVKEGHRAPRAGDSGLSADDYLDMGWEPKLFEGVPTWVRGTKHLAHSTMEPDHAAELILRGLLPYTGGHPDDYLRPVEFVPCPELPGQLSIGEAWLESGPPVSGYPGTLAAGLMRDAAGLIEELLFERMLNRPERHTAAQAIAAQLRGHADAFDHLADPANWTGPSDSWAARWCALADTPARVAEAVADWLTAWAERRRARP